MKKKNCTYDDKMLYDDKIVSKYVENEWFRRKGKIVL